MNDKNKKKLEEMTGNISRAIEKSETPPGDYAYSSSLTTPKARHLAGLWKVEDHTVAGVPFAESYALATFRDRPHSPLTYEATYEFSGNLCIKRVRLHGSLAGDDKELDYEYRMSAVLTWEIKPDVLIVRPVQGYQITNIDGAPVAVRELPNSVAGIIIQYSIDGDALILTDGDDVKRLVRTHA
jgi:hypothetical protein